MDISTTIVHEILYFDSTSFSRGLPAAGKTNSLVAVDSIQSNGCSHPDSPLPQSRQPVNKYVAPSGIVHTTHGPLPPLAKCEAARLFVNLSDSTSH
jgi:hypothetical protein